MKRRRHRRGSSRLTRPEPSKPVDVERGDTLSDLQHNPILEEFAAHYDRERKLFYRGEPAEAREPT